MLERPEINQLKDKGYTWDQPFDIVRLFENKLSAYTGAPYVTVTDCCTHAIELCLRYERPIDKLQLPKHTYLSLPMTLSKLNIEFEFVDKDWTGYYYLRNTKGRSNIDRQQRSTRIFSNSKIRWQRYKQRAVDQTKGIQHRISLQSKH